MKLSRRLLALILCALLLLSTLAGCDRGGNTGDTGDTGDSGTAGDTLPPEKGPDPEALARRWKAL